MRPTARNIAPKAATVIPTAWAPVTVVFLEVTAPPAAAAVQAVANVLEVDLVVLLLLVEIMKDEIVEARELTVANDSDWVTDAEPVAYTSIVVVVTPEPVRAVAGSVSVLCVADTALVCAEQMLYKDTLSFCVACAQPSRKHVYASSPRVYPCEL